MKKKIRLFSALALIVVMLAGCGRGAQTETSSPEKESTTVGEENNSENTTTEYPEYLNLDSYRPIVKEGEEITLRMAVCRGSGTTTDINDVWFKHFIEEKLNINLEIEVLESDVREERKAMMLSANDLPDMVVGIGITTQDVEKYGVENGQFLAMSDYATPELTPNLLKLYETYDKFMENYVATDGKIYGMPRVGATGILGQGDMRSVWRGTISAEWLEAVGLKEAPDTLDGFVEMLRAFKALDPEEMGLDEIWPMIGAGFGFDKMYFQNAFGWVSYTQDYTDACWDMETEKVVIPCMEEKFADYIKLYNTFYKEGLIHPDYFTMDQTTGRALLSEGQPLAWDETPTNYDTDINWQEDYVYPVPLKSQWSETPVATGYRTASESSVFISAETEYPEVCMRLVDFLSSPEGVVNAAYGVPVGSEDTMGLITGYKVDEQGSDITYDEVLSGEYSSAWDYYINNVQIFTSSNLTNATTIADAIRMTGVEPKPIEAEFTSPGDKSGFLCSLAVEGKLRQPLPFLRMSGDIYTEYMDLKTSLKTYVDTETTKFIVGQRPLEEIPKFFDELKNMGIDRYAEIVLGAYENYAGPAN